jgi:hypothetical protein
VFLFLQELPTLRVKTPSRNIASILLPLLWCSYHPFILAACYVIECALEVFPRVLERRSILVRLQVRVDKLNKAIKVFRRDLASISSDVSFWNECTYSIILLVEVVHVAVQNLNKEFHGHRGIHTCVSNTECTLQTFEHSLSIAVELDLSVAIFLQSGPYLRSWGLLRPVP